MDCQATLSISVTQCDPTSATTPLHWPAPTTVHVSCPAKQLAPQQRQGLAIQVLAGTETVSELARQHEVSRKFLYQQVHTAEKALSAAFAPSSRPDDVLFYLPVTKAWLRQLVLALVLICHSSYRGVVELLRDLFDYRIPWGPCTTSCTAPLLRPGESTSSTTSPPSASASSMRSSRRRSRLGGGRCPIHLLLLAESGRASRRRYLGHPAAGTGRPGLRSQATIADFASGLRAGHQEALPEVPCRGDVFHALYDVGPLVRYLENRAYEAIDTRTKLERKQATAKRRHGRKDQSLAKQLSYARPAEAKAIALADEVALLARWLRDDILSVAGPEYAIRRDLLDFVVAELRRESACPDRIRPVRTLLEKQRDNLFNDPTLS